MPPTLDPRRLRALLVSMCVALGLVVGATSSLSVAQPQLATALHASQTDLTWIVNAYVLVFAMLLLPAGIAADRYGRRPALLIGVVAFAAANLASATVSSPAEVIALRAAAGLGATAVMPATLSVLTDAFPEDRRQQAVAVWAAVTGAGALVGVLLAGVLLDVSSWRAIQAVYGAAAVAVLPAIAVLVPPSRNPRLHLDPPGALLSALGVAALAFGVIEAPDNGWGSAKVVVPLAGGVVALVAFVAAELRSADPLLDVRLFANRGLSAGALLVFLISTAAFAFFLLGPQWLQYHGHFSVLSTALRLLPFALGVGPASQLSPRLTERYGPRTVATVATFVMAGGFVGLAATAHAAYVGFVVSLVVFAAGFGAALTSGTSLIIDGLPPERRTVASALNDVTREVGGAAGGAIGSTLLLTAYRSHVQGLVGHLPVAVGAAVHAGAGEALVAAGHAGGRAAHIAGPVVVGFADGYQLAMAAAAVVLAVTAATIAVVAPKPPRSGSVVPDGRTHEAPGAVAPAR